MASALPFIAEDLHLSSLALGSVLSVFFAGYALMQVPGGMVADRLGARRTVTVALVAWSLFTAATGLVKSFSAMLVVRALFGLSEGLFPPAAAKTIATWFPRQEVGRANGIKLAATQLGLVLAPPFAATLTLAWGWQSVFLSLLLPGLILVPIIWSILKDSPTQVPTRGDLTKWEGGEGPHEKPVAATQLVKIPMILWCCAALFAASLATWGLMNWLPIYLLQARGFGVAKMGLFTSLPFFAGGLGYLSGGYLTDRYFNRRPHAPIVLSLAAAALSTYLAAIAPSGEWAVLCLVAAFFFLCIGLSGLFTFPLIVVPTGSVGVAYGVVGTCSQLAALASPILVGYVLDVTHGNFKLVFYCLVSSLLTASFAATQIKGSKLGPIAVAIR